MRNEPGAPPDAGFVPLCVPVVRGNEWNYVKECLDTGWVSSVGSYVDRFERELARRAGTPHAVATVNGTSALHIALLVAGVQPDDEVLVSTLTFIAPANAIRYANAWPVFIDAGPDFWQMDPARVAEFLRECCERRDGVLRNRRTGRRVKAIVPVHILGHPVDMDRILALAREFELVVIEDATESLGAGYRGRKVGALGDLACFSFNGNKVITTGGGGMITTADAEWARKAKYLTTQAKDDPLEYEHHEIGYNYRLTNLQAAMGCAQLEQLDSYIASKRETARLYAEAFADLPGIATTPHAPWAESIDWMFTIRINAEMFGVDSRTLLRRLEAAKIQSRPLWQPMHRSPAHAGAESIGGEVADSLCRECLSLPCSADITTAQRDRVITAVRAAHQLPIAAR
jgi:perosamine synthetase